MLTSSESRFWSFDANYWYQQLSTSEKGLSQQTAAARRQKNGNRQSPESRFLKDSKLFLGQFKSPLMLLLIGAVILSAFLGDSSDVFIILFIVFSTGILSFLQERNAGRVVEKLQSMITLKSSVLRDNQAKECFSNEIVPGDVILLKAGDMIPADCLILESNELHANEASLTGESYPVRKAPGTVEEQTVLSKRTNCLWEGTNIVSGNAKALAILTGSHTIFGNIAQSASRTTETSFERGIRDFGFFLMRITLVLAVMILVINLLNHKSPVEAALFALALAVGMAPELLPAITTIAMSAGAKRMLDRKVIVKKLSSIQNLGEVDLLCTDKTGTITEGVIKVSGLVNAAGADSSFVKQLAFWNASFETGYTNPIDDALRKLDPGPSPLPRKTAEIPYDFIRKRISVEVQTETERLLVTKGAFHEILGICSTVRLEGDTVSSLAPHQQEIESRFEAFGRDGYRVIGICYKPLAEDAVTAAAETDMTFAGFVLLQDPVKEGITATIAALRSLHVDLKIITGDNKNVAASIALTIGIKDPKILTGAELLKSSPEALNQLVRQTHIFAEVEPQQKERIILALRKSFTVAYIGDGINDVAALNAADIGISVDNAVDVAREAADFVLMEKNLMVVVDGIREGRKTFANTLKYIFINTGSTFGNMFSVAVASILLPFIPMLPKQILLMNFITDFPYLTVASDNVDDEQLVKPGKWDLKFIRNYMVLFGIHSSVFDLITFLVLLFYFKTKEPMFQTGWFIESILTELFILFIIRTYKNFFKSKPGKPLFILSLVGLTITLSLPYLPFAGQIGLSPLPFPILLTMLLILACYILTADLLKVWFFRKFQAV